MDLFWLSISSSFLNAQNSKLFLERTKTSRPRLVSRHQQSIITQSVVRNDWQRLSLFMFQFLPMKLEKTLNFPLSPRGFPSRLRSSSVWLLIIDLAKTASGPDRILPLLTFKVLRALDILVKLQSVPMRYDSSSNPPPSILLPEQSKYLRWIFTACSLNSAIPTLEIQLSSILKCSILLPLPSPWQSNLKLASSSPTPPHFRTFRFVLPAPAANKCVIPQNASLCNLFLLKPSYELMLSSSSVSIVVNWAKSALQPFSVILTEASDKVLNFSLETSLAISSTPQSLKLLRSKMRSCILFLSRKSQIYLTPKGPRSYPVALSTSPATAFVNFFMKILFWRGFSLAWVSMSFVVYTLLQKCSVSMELSVFMSGEPIQKAETRRLSVWMEREVCATGAER